MKQISRVMLTMLLFSFFSVSGYAESISIEQKLPIEERLKTVSQTEFSEPELQQAIKMVSRGVPSENSGEFKSYMSYKAITNKDSLQWKLQQECWTDGFGFRRWGDYYCVAMGKFYSEQVGKKFKITFDTNVEIYVVVSDIKMAQHTDSTMRYAKDSSILEFLVDTKIISKMMIRTGNSSYGSEELIGKIIKIEEVIEE